MPESIGIQNKVAIQISVTTNAKQRLALAMTFVLPREQTVNHPL
jgi:hypothetical protein